MASMLENDFVVGLAREGEARSHFVAKSVCEIVDVSSPRCQVIILSPSYKDASQIVEKMRSLAEATGVVALAIGGSIPSYQEEVKVVKAGNIHVLGMVPGFFVYMMEKNRIKTHPLHLLVVLHQCQIMEKDANVRLNIERILSSWGHLIKKVWLIGTSSPNQILKAFDRFDAEFVEVGLEEGPGISHLLVADIIEDNAKLRHMFKILNQNTRAKTIVFCNTKNKAENLAKELSSRGISSTHVHGGLFKSRKIAVLDAFNASHNHVLVATDFKFLAQAPLVINYDVSNVVSVYSDRLDQVASGGSVITLAKKTDRHMIGKIKKSHNVSFEAFK